MAEYFPGSAPRCRSPTWSLRRLDPRHNGPGSSSYAGCITTQPPQILYCGRLLPGRRVSPRDRGRRERFGWTRAATSAIVSRQGGVSDCDWCANMTWRLARPLRVLHVGLRPDTGYGGGVDVASWPLLTAQVAEGVDVTLLVLGELDQTSRAEAARVGVSVTTVNSQRLETLSRDGRATIRYIRPDVVHFHSVFIPAHAQLAKALGRLDIPYFLSPHAGLNLWRGRMKKAIYGSLIEKPYFRRAATIFVLTKRERQVVERWLGPRGRSPQYLELPNSMPALSPGTDLWIPGESHRLVYLGRFDVMKKGLDRLVEIARLLPGVEVNAYGAAYQTERPGFERLCRQGLPANMCFLEPVHGAAKMTALTSATIYVQASRDDGFPMSIVEAMRLGVPVAVTKGCDIAETIGEQDLGMLLSDDPSSAAAELMAAMQDSSRLAHWSRAGREWTINALSPKRTAQRTIRAYEAALVSSAFPGTT
jgi:glycosyltransferase involved in cell wall biosynthesis